jgi:hypothetical protein
LPGTFFVGGGFTTNSFLESTPLSIRKVHPSVSIAVHMIHICKCKIRHLCPVAHHSQIPLVSISLSQAFLSIPSQNCPMLLCLGMISLRTQNSLYTSSMSLKINVLPTFVFKACRQTKLIFNHQTLPARFICIVGGRYFHYMKIRFELVSFFTSSFA